MAKSTKTETQSKNALVRLVTSLVPGQHNTLPISIPVLQALDGDFEAAAILSQCCYWSERTDASDGYFYKSYEEWEDETTIKETRCRKRVKHLENLGLIQTTVRHVYNVPTLHYRVLHEELAQFLIDSREKVEDAQRDRLAKKEEVLKRKRDKRNAENPCCDSIPSIQPDVDLQNDRISTSISAGCIPSFQPDLIQRLQSEITSEITSEISNIDTFLEQKSDTGETQFKNGLANNEKDSSDNGTVGSLNQIQDSGARENDSHSQIEKPIKKVRWQPGQTLYYETDQNDRIIYPKIADIHPLYKGSYSEAIAQADRDTKVWIINNGFVDAVTVETDDDGELYVETYTDEYTPEEALSEIPLAQLFQLGIHPDYGSLSASEYNEYWADRFIYHMSQLDDVPL